MLGFELVVVFGEGADEFWPAKGCDSGKSSSERSCWAVPLSFGPFSADEPLYADTFLSGTASSAAAVLSLSATACVLAYRLLSVMGFARVD